MSEDKTMRIEALETFLDDRTRFEKGDTRTVPYERGAYFCRCGWAKDLDGNVETAPRQAQGETILRVENATHASTAETVGE